MKTLPRSTHLGAVLPRPPFIPKSEFIADIGRAVTDGRGYAAGKIGFSEQHWLYYPIFLSQRPTTVHRRAYEMALRFNCERQAGVYPSDPDNALRFIAFHAQHLANLDCLGLAGTAKEPAIIAYHRLSARTMAYLDMEPDRSVPSNPSLCYLDHFRGRRLLLVAPFARLLEERATRATFEAVWAKTGKSWFEPANVDSVEFPYGYDPKTWQRFPTILDLFAHIVGEIEGRTFDVALVAAGGLGIPIASQIKRMGRVAISLGGHLQVLFGVLGGRWRDRADWQEHYFNAHWIGMPERYHPPSKDRLTDDGAYW
jgi:hypothetical protein